MESRDEIKRPKEAITRLMVKGFRSMKVVQTNLGSNLFSRSEVLDISTRL